MPIRSLLAGLFYCLLPLFMKAQQRPASHSELGGFTVEQIGLQQGLPNADIHTLFRDRAGFLWLGTSIGLIQYDGFSFKTISMTGDGQPLGLVNALLEDTDGYLWVATEDGLFIVRHEQASAVRHVQNNQFVRMNTLLFDRNQNLWFGTGSGAYHLTRADQQTLRKNPAALVRPIALPGFNRLVPKTTHRRVFSLALDEKGSLYIGGKYDLFRYRPNKPVERIWQSPKDQKTEIWSLAVRSSSDIVFSVHDMFSYVRLRNGKAEPLLPGIVPSDVLWTGHEYWLLSYGLTSLKPTDDQPIKRLSLYEATSGDFTKLLLDHEGIFWVATNEGLIKIRRSQFERVPLPDAVAGGEINSFGTYNGQFLFGAHHGRVFSLTGNTIQQQLGNLVSIAGVSGIEQDQRGTLWLATTYQGLLSFNGQVIKKYTAADGLGDEGFNSILSTQQNGLWAMGDAGITHIQFDRVANQYKLLFFEHATNRYRFTIFYNAIEAPDQTLWLASDFGLFSFRNGTFYQHQVRVQGKIIRSIRKIIRDGQGFIWLATDGQGLVQGRVTGQAFQVIRQYTTQEGLTSNSLLDVFADSRGNIWTGSATALTCLSQPGRPTEMLKTVNYADGFFAESYQSLCFAEYPAGTLWIGTSAGLMRFSLNQLATASYRPKLLIDQVQLRDEHEDINRFAEGRDTLTGLPTSLALPPDQNALTFSFVMTSLANAPFNRYRFQLIGADASWRVASGNDRTVTYSGLSPGSYTFQVEGIAATGNRSIPARFSFIILPPFWLRWWFMAGSLLMLAGGLRLYLRWREKQVKQREAEKSRISQLIAELETRAIRSQMNPHFIFNCLNAIQECILADDTDTAYRYLSKFSRLLRLVLEESTKNVHSLQQEIDILRLYLDLEALRFGSSFSYSLDIASDLDTHLYQVPALLLQPLAENAIRHGLLHKSGLRQLAISLNSTETGTLTCMIQDNGIGRQRSTQLAQRATAYAQKTSKGLTLTHERLALLEKAGLGQASMHIDDLVDADGQPIGTCIYIQLPLITEMR